MVVGAIAKSNLPLSICLRRSTQRFGSALLRFRMRRNAVRDLPLRGAAVRFEFVAVRLKFVAAPLSRLVAPGRQCACRLARALL
jgi:hypothetical protein